MDSTANSTSTSPAPLTQAEQAELDERLFAVASGYTDNVNALNALIQSGANPSAQRNALLTETVLMVACKVGHPNIAKALISHLDVPALNAANELGVTALMHAAFADNEFIVAALINAGADVQHHKGQGNALLRAALPSGHDRKGVAFQLFSAMSPFERYFAPYTPYGDRPLPLLGHLLSRPNLWIAEAWVQYQASESELRERVVNISAGLSAGQNPQNNLGTNTELLALIAEYAFSNCLVNGHARREVMETMRTITPQPTVMFSIGSIGHSLGRRVRNVATEAVDRTIRHFIHAASIPSVIPCPVPAIEDKRAEQGPSKKARQ